MNLQQAYVDELKKQLTDENVSHIKVVITDINGVLRSKYLSLDKFLSAVTKGFGFCDVISGSDIDDQLIDDLTLTGWHSGYPDGQVNIITDSMREIPFEPNTRLVLGQYQDSHLCPRRLLEKVAQRAEEKNLTAIAGMEFEFTLFDETPQSLNEKNYHRLAPLTLGNHGYSFLKPSAIAEFYQELLHTCEVMNINIEGLHTEIGPGVLEAAIGKAPILEAADKAILFKNIVKTLALRRGWMACFMAKWSNEHQGQSGHIHLSLLDDAGENCFFDDSQQYNMSETMKHFLGGQQALMPELLVMNTPYINSFNRLTPGFWAPTQASWGLDNRTCALRVITPNKAAARIEYRIPGADCNPYLAMVAALSSGLWGIDHKQQATSPISGNAYEQPLNAEYQLPHTMEQACARFRHSEVAKQLFDEAFIKDFSKTREWEAICARRAITDWQLNRYFELA